MGAGKSSGKFQKPLYSKLANFPKTQDKSHFNFATIAFLNFNKDCLRREFEAKAFFYLADQEKKSGTDKEVS